MRNRIAFYPYGGYFTVKLIAHGDELQSTNIRVRFNEDNHWTGYLNYELGHVLTGIPYRDSQHGYVGIEFEINGQSKDSSNYFQFVTEDIETREDVKGFIDLEGHLGDVNDKYAFYNLFADCENIYTADRLWIGRSTGETTVGALTEAKKYAYANMFKNCTSLKTPPRMFMNQNTTLNDWCFAGMFNNCKSLSSVPDLPASSLAMCCYNSMFYNCRGLSTVPSGLLSAASELAPFCYNSMFNYCTSLTDAPVLSASTLVNGCYKNMFMDCKNLSSITVSFTEWNENYTGNWVKGVGPYGTFNRPNALAEQYGNSKIPLGWDRVLQTITVDQIPQLVFDEDQTSLSITSYVHYTGILPLYYMINGQLPVGLSFENGVFTYDITQVEEDTEATVTLVIVAKDAEAVFQSINILEIVEYDPLLRPLTFKGTASTNAVQLNQFGSPSAIVLDYSKNNGPWTTYNVGDVIELNKNEIVAFSGANDHFSKDTSNYYQFTMSGTIEAIGNVQSLMNFSDSVTSACYYEMFRNCTSLTEAPALPATELANGCYFKMFEGCTSLISAPVLPATGLAQTCYEWMFSNCTSLTSAPQLPATTLADECYYAMFSYCRSLTDAPQLPATRLTFQCYNMMFYQCNLLSSMNVSFTDWNNTTYKTGNWVYGVAPTGIFYKPSALPEEYGFRFIPSGWTVRNI